MVDLTGMRLMNESQYNNTPAYRGTAFPDGSLAAGLTYALPLRKIALTGKYANPVPRPQHIGTPASGPCGRLSSGKPRGNPNQRGVAR